MDRRFLVPILVLILIAASFTLIQGPIQGDLIAKKCPYGMVFAGSYCIDKSVHSYKANLSEAVITCREEGKRLCRGEEITYACLKEEELRINDIPQEIEEIEWVSDVYADSLSTFLGHIPSGSGPDCAVFGGWGMQPYNFRCCMNVHW